MNSTKQHILASIIVTMAFIVIGISSSYAFYENSINGGPIYVGVNSGSGINIGFTSGNTINAVGALIDDTNMSNVLSSETYTDFQVNMSEGNCGVYDLYITDIKMTGNFKSEYLKWALYQSSYPVSNNAVPVATGDFRNASLLGNADSNGMYNVESILLKSNVNINTSDTHNYVLFVWLSYDDEVNQNELLEGVLNAKVGIKAKTGTGAN